MSPRTKRLLTNVILWITVFAGSIGLFASGASAIGTIDARYVKQVFFTNQRQVDSLQRLREYDRISSKLDTLKACIKHPEDCR